MSLKVIAKKLGLSVTTVSRALNGYDDVAEETRLRVEEEARRRGYRPNTFARRLKMGKIDAVGLVFPVRSAPLSNYTFMDMVAEISHELATQEIDLLLIADEDTTDHHAFLRMVESRRVDALIIAHTLPDDARLHCLQELNFPFLALGRSNLPSPYAWFDFDNQAGVALATDRLVSLGHQRIAFLGENNPQSFIIQRREGYLAALQIAGLAFREAYFCLIEPSRRAGYQATLDLLALAEPPTAIVTDCSTQGEGAALALRECGRLQGENAISLIIYDGLPGDSIIDTPVTAITQATRAEVGRQIAQMVFRLIAGQDVSTLQVLWQPQLCLGSTDNPPSH
ncbi:substrate-binding domain-containing protein [Pectobacteriaceae bacterium CE70]|uniref:Transcriptional regulator n=1 Tax=Serratia sp. (strain ATCC 39006) TaxID=104623 RepID=A0A2I5T9Y7_SERS3|nr:substrate-binding domain-containing protein [Serratia sp. ATCC 39006]WJV63988.1 substrate-binding domain-containing protein [Pectobacteriaceae bacterium C52]WJV68400.1 substrate-binding domain-containing protein [Pectobacteriaceae bacterium CE70]WJY12332.1 substrate-binding domain-containing protein [Pectobacteriaceae bacterium C80]AUH01381.1 transcriptional regulator [Serratia sp. ATCC 39006]AUH05702.1 transcriptional regulator [Serratia sp. ATCC 39006]